MSRRTGALLALIALAALALSAPAPAKRSLAQKVQTLTAKLNCLQRYPVYAFSDYAYYDLSGPSVPVLSAEEEPQEIDVLRDNQEVTALDFNYGPTMSQSDAYLLGIKNTSSCRSKFALAPNPVSFVRVASTAKMLRLQY